MLTQAERGEEEEGMRRKSKQQVNVAEGGQVQGSQLLMERGMMGADPWRVFLLPDCSS